jgi:hypothetical protein
MSCSTTQPWLDDLMPQTDAMRAGVRLKRDQTVGFEVVVGSVVSCRSGAVWLTPGDGGDVELYAGGTFVVTRAGHAVAWAVEDAVIVVDER